VVHNISFGRGLFAAYAAVNLPFIEMAENFSAKTGNQKPKTKNRIEEVAPCPTKS
jgi:hypothetical protein